MKLTTNFLHRFAVLAAVLAAPGQTALAQQYAPYGYTNPQAQPAMQQSQPMGGQQYAAVGYQPNGFAMPANNLEAVPPGPRQQAPHAAAQHQVPQQPRQQAGMQAGNVVTGVGYNNYANNYQGQNNYQAAPPQQMAQPMSQPMGPGYESYSAGGVMPTGGFNYDTFSGGCGNGSFGSGCGQGGCAVGGCGPCGAGGNVCYTGLCNPCGPRRHWFGGVYGLLMDRVGCGKTPLAFTTTTPGIGYYPTDSEIVMSTADLDNDIQGGAEFRFGATCSPCAGGCGFGGCNSGCNGCGPLAWEAAYWGLAKDTVYTGVVDTATFVADGDRTYGMIDYRGLWYNGRPVNDYFDYGTSGNRQLLR